MAQSGLPLNGLLALRINDVRREPLQAALSDRKPANSLNINQKNPPVSSNRVDRSNVDKSNDRNSSFAGVMEESRASAASSSRRGSHKESNKQTDEPASTGRGESSLQKPPADQATQSGAAVSGGDELPGQGEQLPQSEKDNPSAVGSNQSGLRPQNMQPDSELFGQSPALVDTLNSLLSGQNGANSDAGVVVAGVAVDGSGLIPQFPGAQSPDAQFSDESWLQWLQGDRSAVAVPVSANVVVGDVVGGDADVSPLVLATQPVPLNASMGSTLSANGSVLKTAFSANGHHSQNSLTATLEQTALSGSVMQNSQTGVSGVVSAMIGEGADLPMQSQQARLSQISLNGILLSQGRQGDAGKALFAQLLPTTDVEQADTSLERGASLLSKLQSMPVSYRSVAGTTVASAVIQPQLGTPQWGQSVAERMVWFSARNISSAELHLDPPELGPLQVRISSQNDQTSITFTSQHVAVREALDQNLPRLREIFAENGLDLADVNVAEQGAGQRKGEADTETDDLASAESKNVESNVDAEQSTANARPLNLQLVDAYV